MLKARQWFNHGTIGRGFEFSKMARKGSTLSSVRSQPPEPLSARTAPSGNDSNLFQGRLEAVAAETEALIDRLLQPDAAAGEISRPARLLEAMRYATLGGGKRLRPFLVVETANLFDVARGQALMV